MSQSAIRIVRPVRAVPGVMQVKPVDHLQSHHLAMAVLTADTERQLAARVGDGPKARTATLCKLGQWRAMLLEQLAQADMAMARLASVKA